MPLLVERLLADAVGESLHDERAIVHGRQDERRRLHVVAEQIALREAEVRPEHLGQIGDAQGVAIRQRELAVLAGVLELVEAPNEQLKGAGAGLLQPRLVAGPEGPAYVRRRMPRSMERRVFRSMERRISGSMERR